MKPFRLYLRSTPPETKPEKCRDDYSNEELAEFREEYRKNEDRRSKQLIPLLTVLMGCILGMTLPLDEWRNFDVEFRCICLVTFVAVSLYGAWLGNRKCPACRRETEEYLADYCASCGEKSIVPAKCLSGPRCGLCGATSGNARTRSSFTRYCTSCGIELRNKED